MGRKRIFFGFDMNHEGFGSEEATQLVVALRSRAKLLRNLKKNRTARICDELANRFAGPINMDLVDIDTMYATNQVVENPVTQVVNSSPFVTDVIEAVFNASHPVVDVVNNLEESVIESNNDIVTTMNEQEEVANP